MKIAILGDTHIGVRGDSMDFHRFFKRFYDECFFPELNKRGIKNVIQLGDLFDRRKFINFNSLYLSRGYFFDKFRDNGITLDALIGNHDIFYKSSLNVNSPELLLGDYKDTIRIHKEFTTLQFDGVDVDIVPWLCAENFESSFERMKQSKADICLGHFEIDGFEMDRGNIHHGGLDRKQFQKYDIVFSGHFHHRSIEGNIHYVGTPYELTWMDYNDLRGFHIFDTDTRMIEFVPNPFVMFNKIVYDDGATDIEYWKNFNYAKFENMYVKVVALNRQNSFLFDTVIDNLYKANVSDVSVVEDFTEVTTEEDENIVDQAEDTITILSKYVDTLKLSVDPQKLKKQMREIYIEALNIESIE